jgi:hypothetical protein
MERPRPKERKVIDNSYIEQYGGGRRSNINWHEKYRDLLVEFAQSKARVEELNKMVDQEINARLEALGQVEELQSAQDIIEYVLLHGENHSEIGQMLEEMVSEHKAKAEGGEK